MTDFKVPPGSTLNVELHRKRKPKAQTPATSAEEDRGIIAGATDDPTRYVFRSRAGSVAFYDLGTRLRSVVPGVVFDGLRFREMVSSDSSAPDDDMGRVSEYIEIRAEVAGTYVGIGEVPGVGVPFMAVSDSEAAELDRALLGRRAPDAPTDPGQPGEPLDPVDPFGFSRVNGSARKVANCQELTVEMYIADALSGFAVAAGLTRETPADALSGERLLISLALAPILPHEEVDAGRWMVRAGEVSDEAERWNPLNVASGAAQHQVEIAKAHHVRAEGDLLVGGFGEPAEDGRVLFGPNAGWYVGFDTGDAENFKVTAEPSFESDAVKFKFKGDNRVYLRPRFAGITLDDNVTLMQSVAWVSRLFTVYPILGTSALGTLGSAFGCAAERSALSGAPDAETQLWAYLNVYREGYEVAGEVFVARSLGPGALVAAVAQGEKVFYVWSVSGIRDEMGAPTYHGFGACGG